MMGQVAIEWVDEAWTFTTGVTARYKLVLMEGE